MNDAMVAGQWVVYGPQTESCWVFDTEAEARTALADKWFKSCPAFLFYCAAVKLPDETVQEARATVGGG